MTEILLKARPTEAQLRNRLLAPIPDGLELYLDRQDLLGDDWLEGIVGAVEAAPVPRDFVWIVEAPIRTLAGEYFDLSKNDPDHRETLRRVVEAGRAIGAVAANAHVMAPTTDPALLTQDERRRKLDCCSGLLGYYVELSQAANLLPQVENVPPVGRMRESAFVFSAIGAAAADLRLLAEWFPKLRLTIDVSHAALFLNWCRTPLTQIESWLQPVARYNRGLAQPGPLAEYLSAVLDLTTTIHVSNTRGLLGEGLGYLDGDENLDDVLTPALGRVPYLVTETVELDPEQASGMREAQRRLSSLRQPGVAD